jgi:hypothetical protein
MHSSPSLARRSVIAALAIAAVVIATVGCSGETESEPGPRVPPPQSCFAPENLGGMPRSIAAAVELINALPKPLTVPCLLQTLERPLAIDATSNDFSAQPAYGPNNPRIFIFRGDLILSVVPKGDGRPLVELSERRPAGMSVKGELHFPVEAELAPPAPYERVVAEGGGSTKCNFCHLSETRDDGIDFAEAYISSRIPVSPDRRVDLPYLDWVVSACQPDWEPDRCAMLDGIFSYGEVVEASWD